MFITIKDVNTHYKKQGNATKALILLHGWGQNMTMMQPIADHFQDIYSVYNIDFPGFGESSEPNEPWGVEEYTEFLKEFIEKLELTDVTLVAHSFGARVALLYASTNKVTKMVITGGAGIRNKRGVNYYFKVYSYKAMKQVLKLPFLKSLQKKFQNQFGSEDYKNTSGVMRASFVKIVNLDLTPILSKITSEVLLVWGSEDEATPLWMGKKMEELIPNAGLAVFEGDGHYAYWHQMTRFLTVMDIFLRENK